MNMKQLRYVIVLSRYNNFTRAAEELGISQPSLSQYIKKIEKQTGVELFLRCGQDVRLTDAGADYIRIGRKILDLENEMNNRFMDISAYRRGKLTIGIAPYRSVSMMPKAIAAFRKEYPGIEVILKEGITQELKESAARGKLDLCVSTLPVDEQKFIYRHIMNEDTVLAVPKSLCPGSLSEYENYEKVSIKQFADNYFISFPSNQLMGAMLEDLGEKCGFEANICVECEDQLIAHVMVAAQVGAALLPLSLVKDNEDSNTKYFLLEEQTPKREIVVFYRKEQYLSKPAASMIELLAKGDC